MALVPCAECKNKISSRAEACPHCGFPYRETERLKKEKAAKRAAEVRKSLKLRKLTVEHAKAVSFEIAGLRELQEEIGNLVDDDPVLTEWEEAHLDELEARAEGYYDIVRRWSESLPKDLQEYADEITSQVEDLYRLAGSFEELARLVLIEEWGDDDDPEDWDKIKDPIQDYLERRGYSRDWHDEEEADSEEWDEDDDSEDWDEEPR